MQYFQDLSGLKGTAFALPLTPVFHNWAGGLVCVGSSRHQRPQMRAKGVRVSVIGLCIIVANAHATDMQQNVHVQSSTVADLAKTMRFGSDGNFEDLGTDHDNGIRIHKVDDYVWALTSTLTIEEPMALSMHPVSARAVALSHRRIDEVWYEGNGLFAQAHVTDLWCIACSSDYPCTFGERTHVRFFVEGTALTAMANKQCGLPEGGISIRSIIDESIWRLPETVGEAMLQPRRVRLVNAWPNLVDLLNGVRVSSDLPVRLQTYGIQELFLGTRFTYAQGYGPGEILAAIEALWHREINGGNFLVHPIRPQPVDTPRDCVALIVQIWSPFIDVDFVAPVVIDTIHYSHQPRGTDGGFTQVVDYLPRWASSQNIFAKVSLAGICPSDIYRCVIQTMEQSYQRFPDYVTIEPGYYLIVTAMPSHWYVSQDRVTALLDTLCAEAARFTMNSDDESVLVRVHGYSTSSASLGRRSYLLTRHLYHDLHAVRNLAIELWRDVYAVQQELVLVHAPLPSIFEPSESVNLILGPRTPQHLVPVLVSIFSAASAHAVQYREHGPFGIGVPREAPFEAFRRSFWNSAGQQIIAAPGRVWCENRYYDFEDALPIVAGTHLLVYDASTQSDDSSTYTEWSAEDTTDDEMEVDDDDRAV